MAWLLCLTRNFSLILIGYLLISTISIVEEAPLTWNHELSSTTMHGDHRLVGCEWQEDLTDFWPIHCFIWGRFHVIIAKLGVKHIFWPVLSILHAFFLWSNRFWGPDTVLLAEEKVWVRNCLGSSVSAGQWVSGEGDTRNF